MKGRVAAIALAGLVAVGGEARADAETHAKFRTTMDSVFGSGTWRITGGYRTQARENELRAQGALTVAPGRISRHSTGTRAHPGAYDVVVEGLDPFRAAARLRRANAPFRTIFAKGRHGTQGPHLHIDPYAGPAGRGARAPGLPWVVANPTPEQLALGALRERAAQGDAQAQLELGVIYSQGVKGARRSLVEAYVWTAYAATNGDAAAGLRTGAQGALAALKGRMTPDEILDAQQFLPDAEQRRPVFAYGVIVGRRSDNNMVRIARADAPVILVGTTPATCSAGSVQGSCALGGREVVRVR